MAKTQAPGKRARLIQAAAELVYRQGFGPTTIADMAGKADVPLGNVYYYFKTKEAIGAALVEEYLASHRSLRRSWESEYEDPRERLSAFVVMTLENRGDLARSGCPMGSLCTELAKSGGPLAEQASRLLVEWVDWAEQQFRGLGAGDASPGLARHLLAALQGAAVLAHSFGTSDLVEAEARRLIEWIAALKEASDGTGETVRQDRGRSRRRQGGTGGDLR
ncbi:MAG TPA: TetR/AcrR family transcriptional regulator [Acidimicrobiia bacterium]|nr:TetR/AcrR family transcriptional regulator [Acidimicrobiia bacterium]